MDKLVEINNNMGRNIEYSIEFFKYTDYELTIDRPTMLEGSYWYLFLSKTETLKIPLLKISSCSKTQKIWFRNTSNFDKIVVELDNSLDSNIIEFIAKKTKYKTITLDDMKTLGCVIWLDYIDNNGYQQKDRLYVGRPVINTYTDDKLSLTIEQLNKMLKGSDFENNVAKYPTGAFHSFLSLKEAFSRIYNIPRNFVGTNSRAFAMTPFKLNEETYVPTSTEDIVLIDGNLEEDSYVYAEDSVAGTTRNIKCQFYYKMGSPECGYKMTEYNDDGDIITSEDTSVMEWNVWGNTQEALDRFTVDGYSKQIITQWQRYFRPFRIVLAGDNEVSMYDDGNYRIRRDYTYGDGDYTTSETNNNFYEPVVKNTYWKQEEIKSGKFLCQKGDRLVYFEVLGDVRFRTTTQEQSSANILYDSYSTIYVYNMDRDIVYFDHVTSFVQTIPLPKQWLDMDDYINTESLFYSSRLEYTSENNDYSSFLSYMKPLCSLNVNRFATASSRSLKRNQDEYGKGGDFVGEKMFAFIGFGLYDLDVTANKEYIGTMLDKIMANNKPKSIRISDDGLKIYFLKNTYSGFTEFPEDVEYPPIVKASEYTEYTQIPKMFKYCYKYLYIEDFNGNITTNEREWNDYRYITYSDSVSMGGCFVNEITDRLNDNSVVLIDNPIWFLGGDYQGNTTNVVQVTDDYTVASSSYLVTTNVACQAVNIMNNSGNSYWSYKNITFENLSIFGVFDSTYTVLDYNKSLQRAIIQTPTDLIYYDSLNETVLYSKSKTGLDFLYSMNRDSFYFTNPIDFHNDELFYIGSILNQAVRLLSYSGNRYTAGEGLASSFLKNSYYDGDGVLNIGFTGEKYELTDYSIISNSLKKYKYDSLEITTQAIQTDSFTQIETDDTTSEEEENIEYNESISINMSSKQDIQLDFTVNRTSSTEITWTAVGSDSKTETGTVSVVGFDYFVIDLTGIFDGISITCNFFNTELAQGEKFRGTINRKEYIDDTNSIVIVDDNESFPFMDDNILNLKFPFLYELYKSEFSTKMNEYFMNGLSIREFNEFEIEVPSLLFFDTSYKPFTVGNIITLSSDSKYINGYSLDNGIITPYNENKCDYFIESMVYNMSKGTTKLNLISV